MTAPLPPSRCVCGREFAPDGPKSDELLAALLRSTPIEWNRLGGFQDLTVRLIAERLLRPRRLRQSGHGLARASKWSKAVSNCKSGWLGTSRKTSRKSTVWQRWTEGKGHRSGPGVRAEASSGEGEGRPTDVSEQEEPSLDRTTTPSGEATYVEGEITMHELSLPPLLPGKKCHIFCSEHNPGGLELLQELQNEKKLRLKITQDDEYLSQCNQMLVYLTQRTWSCGASSDTLATQVEKAMRLRIPLLLAHEMTGLGQEGRNACEFGFFFSVTPAALLRNGIYATIAVPLKGGQWRQVSMALLGKALAVEEENQASSMFTPILSMSATVRDGTAAHALSVSRVVRAALSASRLARIPQGNEPHGEFRVRDGGGTTQVDGGLAGLTQMESGQRTPWITSLGVRNALIHRARVGANAEAPSSVSSQKSPTLSGFGRRRVVPTSSLPIHMRMPWRRRRRLEELLPTDGILELTDQSGESSQIAGAGSQQTRGRCKSSARSQAVESRSTNGEADPECNRWMRI